MYVGWSRHHGFGNVTERSGEEFSMAYHRTTIYKLLVDMHYWIYIVEKGINGVLLSCDRMGVYKE